MAPVDAGKLPRSEFKLFLESFDYVLSDCDGVLWNSSGPYPGAGAVFEEFKALGKRVHFVSNNSARTVKQFRDRFQSCGITDGVENLTIPTDAIADYLKSVNFDKKIFCVSNSAAIKGLQQHGLQCKEGPAMGGEEFLPEYVRYAAVDDPEVGAVLFDGDFRVNLPKLYMAAAYLRRPDVHFLSGPTDRVLPITKDLNVMGMGQFCDMVAEFSGRQPVVLAKPGAAFATFLLRRLDISAAAASRVLFVGDMLEQDVGLGKVAGFKTLLVLGTQTQEEMLREPVNTPDFYTDSMEDLRAQLQLAKWRSG